MSRKTKLGAGSRDQLLSFMVGKWDEKNKDRLDKPWKQAVKVVNSIIRAKYPEKEMAVLRKYKLTRSDTCLRFMNKDTQQFFAGDYSGLGEKKYKQIGDLPYNRGCSGGDRFSVTAEEQVALEDFEKLRLALKDEREAKKREYRGFLLSCRYVEEVMEVLPFTDEMKQRFLKEGTELVVFNPDNFQAIKQEFKQAA